MKTKKKFGMRRHIGITAAATLIALGATACEEAYWGGKDNYDTYKGLINNFNTKNGSFDATLNCEGSDNCFWNEMHDGCSANAEDNIQNLKILLAPNIKSDADKRLVVICSKWMEGKDSYELIMEPKGTLKIDKGISIDDNDINYYNDWLCKLDSERKLGRLICDEIAYYLYDGKTYSKCDKGKCGDLDKEMPEAFKNAFNYRACPDGYDYRAKYIGGLTNVCVKSVCNGVSINLYTDNNNCGTCGNKCSSKGPGYTCVSGECIPADKSKVLCKGEFINPENDPRYCGAKDGCENFVDCQTVDGKPLCSNGRCVSTCVGNQILCDGKCVDPSLDVDFCGAKADCKGSNAGKQCNKSMKEVCSNGSCGLNCVTGQIVCDNRCIDPLTDNTYCGASGDCKGSNAGKKCESGNVCSTGKCEATCLTGQILCGGNRCIDPQNDNTYCGAKDNCQGDNAGVACPGGQVCLGGTCGTSCLSSQVLCGGKCIVPEKDNEYCGATGDCKDSNAGEKCESGNVCSGGTCGTSCLSSQVLCGDKCIVPETDNTYCGATGDCKGSNAGEKCDSGKVCSGGTCSESCLSGQVLCGGKCIVPETDNTYCGAKGKCNNTSASSNDYKGATCASGEVCSGGTCGASCLSGQVLCGGKCILPETDNTYCGAKGKCNNTSASSNDYKGATCASGEVCSGGTCGASCLSDQVLCGGKCIVPETDNAYCGAKGKCDSASASDANYRGNACTNGTKCSEGRCVVTCTSNQIVCGNECIDPKTNNKHCGASGSCNQANGDNYKGDDCNDATKYNDGDYVCIDSKCTLNTCINVNDIPCTVTIGDKTERRCVNVYDNNNQHCGGCNVKCESIKIPESKSAECVGGLCTVTECNEGSHPSSNGLSCELDTIYSCGSDRENCVIMIGLDTSDLINNVECSGGQCKAKACKTGYHLSNDQCVVDTREACGAEPMNCTSIDNLPKSNKEEAVDCVAGKCLVKNCGKDYQVSEDKTKCEKKKN